MSAKISLEITDDVAAEWTGRPMRERTDLFEISRRWSNLKGTRKRLRHISED